MLQGPGGTCSSSGWWVKPLPAFPAYSPPFLPCTPLQSEDKVSAVASLSGPLMALNHAVQQDYFPKALVPLLQAFVTK